MDEMNERAARRRQERENNSDEKFSANDDWLTLVTVGVDAQLECTRLQVDENNKDFEDLVPRLRSAAAYLRPLPRRVPTPQDKGGATEAKALRDSINALADVHQRVADVVVYASETIPTLPLEDRDVALTFVKLKIVELAAERERLLKAHIAQISRIASEHRIALDRLILERMSKKFLEDPTTPEGAAARIDSMLGDGLLEHHSADKGLFYVNAPKWHELDRRSREEALVAMRTFARDNGAGKIEVRSASDNRRLEQ